MNDDATEWLASATEDGVVHFRVGRRGESVVAEWVDYGTLVASRDGQQWELTFADDIAEPQRDKLRNGGARVLLSQLRGELALHGSAVGIAGRAIVLVGASGAGKSTLAAALCARGATMLADDAVSLRVAPRTSTVEPTEALHWLDAASCTALSLPARPLEDAKVAVRAARIAEEALPIAAVIELAWSDAPLGITRAGAIESIARLLPHVGRILVDSPERHRLELDQLTMLFESAPLCTLSRPRDFQALDDAVHQLVDLASPQGGE